MPTSEGITTDPTLLFHVYQGPYSIPNVRAPTYLQDYVGDQHEWVGLQGPAGLALKHLSPCPAGSGGRSSPGSSLVPLPLGFPWVAGL